MLLLEQPANVNPQVSAAAKRSWRAIWKGSKPVVLLLLMSSVLFLELVVYRLWLAEELCTLKALLLVVLALAAPFLLVSLALALRYLLGHLPFRITKRSKRTLRLDEKGVKLSQTEHDRLRWKHVRRWLLAPVPGQEELVNLTLEAGGKSSRRYWSIVLDERVQKHALTSELEHLRQIGKSDAPVVELSQPLPERKPALRAFWAVVLACYLIIHGLPLLGLGLMPLDAKESPSNSELTPSQKAKLERALLDVFKRLHISTTKQFRALFLVPGLISTTAGVGLGVWANRRQSQEAAELYRLYDLELEIITCGSNWRSH